MAGRGGIEPRAQKVRPRAMQTYSRAPRPNQGIANMGLTGFQNSYGPVLKPSFFPLEKDCPPTGECRMWRVYWGGADNLRLWLQRPEDGRNYLQGASPRG